MATEQQHSQRRTDTDSDDTSQLDVVRIGKAYTIVEVARLARAHPVTVRRWAQGLKSSSGHMDPLRGEAGISARRPLMLSFLDLAEFVVVNQFRKGIDGHPPVPLDRLRHARQYVEQALHAPYPFASLDLQHDGAHVLSEFQKEQPGRSLLVLDEHGHQALPVLVLEEMEHFSYDDRLRLAEEWAPYGPQSAIVINPRRGAGRPTIRGTGVTVWSIQQRAKAGESIRFIARDYDIEESAVAEALRSAA